MIGFGQIFFEKDQRNHAILDIEQRCLKNKNDFAHNYCGKCGYYCGLRFTYTIIYNAFFFGN